MIMQTFPNSPFSPARAQDLVGSLRKEYAKIWVPQPEAADHYRLQVLPGPVPVQPGVLCRLPLKKLLLPAREELWSLRAGSYQAPAEPEPIAVIGLPLCELQATWYLDRVFAEDAGYQRRRGRMLLIGSSCQPDEKCRCHANLPVAGDLFLSEERLWVLSAAGEELLSELQIELMLQPPGPLPRPEPLGVVEAAVDPAQFRSQRQAGVWQREGRKCFSCGACSAVCPTCYCFDLLDEVALAGGVTRYRAWDNCFFTEHGLVAGGHNFRPDRAERLRFRFEHKKLGFGDLQGVASCVGCGRCREVCPVGIDLDRIAEALQEEA